MSAVTPAGFPSPPRPGRRRWWLLGLVGAWIVVVAVLAVWSVGNEPATVPEQRDLARAIPDLQRATGVVFAAASGPGRAVVLDDLTLTGDCRVTPVRRGVVATRTVTMYVGAGKAAEALDDVVAALPPAYQGEVARSRGGTRLSLFADAGDFIAVEATAEATGQIVGLRLSTGCRPTAGTPGRDSPAAPPAPPLLAEVLTALSGAGGAAAADPAPSAPAGATPGDAARPGSAPSAPAGATPRDAARPAVRAVACPGAKVAASYVVDGVPMPRDLPGRLRPVARGAEVVRSDAAAFAFRAGGESAVVTREGGHLRVSVTTAC